MSTVSGVVRTFLRPPGGTRHSRIRASSPAMERGVYLHCRAADTWLPCPLRAWSLLSALGTQAPYPQRDDVGQRGPRLDPLQLSHSAVWAMPCQAGGLAAAAGGGSPPRHVRARQGSQLQENRCLAPPSTTEPPTPPLLAGPSSLP